MALTNFLIKAIHCHHGYFRRSKITLDGTFPKVGDTAPNFTLVNGELKDISLKRFQRETGVTKHFSQSRHQNMRHVRKRIQRESSRYEKYGSSGNIQRSPVRPIQILLNRGNKKSNSPIGFPE